MAETSNTSNSQIDETDETRKKQASTRGAEGSESNRSNITVTYSLWVGSNVSEKYSLNVTVDRNVTFYEIMERAADLDSKYS